jgi:sialidase-1
MVVLVYLFIISLHIRKGSSLFQSLTPPPSISRSDATYDWCDCNTGNNVTIWPINNKTEAVNVSSGAPVWIHFEQPTSKIAWSCHGMTTNQQSSLNVSLNIWSVQLLPQKKGFGCEKTSGRLHFVNWKHSKGQSVVYSSGENGYACIKIPVLLRSISGRLLAFAEARMITCSDFAWTDLVLKTSDDNGKTWSSLQVVRSESNAKSVPTVIGNAAPVQLQLHGGRRILVPHTRNNSDVWTIFSDDDGNSWSKPTLIGKNVTRSDWKWVGTGPPGSLQLKNGRIIVPSYHSKVRGNLINNIVHGHVMLSDDNGITWRLGQQENGFGNGNHFVNENQAVELLNGSILINGRSFATFTKPRRLQTMSHDGGETFGNVTFVHHLKQPFNGCQGSIVGPLVEINDTVGSLYFTGPDSILKRDHLTLFVSKDSGQTWNKLLLVDSGASGYSSLQIISRNSSTIGNRFDHINHSTLGLLYEQSDVDALIMAPDRFVYRTILL